MRVHTTEEVTRQGDGKGVHLPSPSYWPIVAAFSLPIVAYGLIYTLWLCLLGGVIFTIAIFGWVFEPPDAPSSDHAAGHGPSDAHGEVEPAATDADAEAEGAAADAPGGDAGEKEVEPVG